MVMPVTNTSRMNEWTKLYRISWATIHMHLSKTGYYTVQACPTTYELWKTLSGTYEKKVAAMTIYLSIERSTCILDFLPKVGVPLMRQTSFASSVVVVCFIHYVKYVQSTRLNKYKEIEEILKCTLHGQGRIETLYLHVNKPKPHV